MQHEDSFVFVFLRNENTNDTKLDLEMVAGVMTRERRKEERMVRVGQGNAIQVVIYSKHMLQINNNSQEVARE
jgi:hypothetical protein